MKRPRKCSIQGCSGDVHSRELCNKHRKRLAKGKPLEDQPERPRLTNSQKHYRLKERVIKYLGGECAKCGISDTRVLQIDHIDGGGRDQRLFVSWSTMVRWILLGIYPKKFQLLCANCHMIKSSMEQGRRE